MGSRFRWRGRSGRARSRKPSPQARVPPGVYGWEWATPLTTLLFPFPMPTVVARGEAKTQVSEGPGRARCQVWGMGSVGGLEVRTKVTWDPGVPRKTAHLGTMENAPRTPEGRWPCLCSLIWCLKL